MKQTRREFIKTVLAAACMPLFRNANILPKVEATDLCHCGHCGKAISADDAEVCWYCGADLCVDCWDCIGHCGHVEAHRQNHEAAGVRQPDVPLATARHVHWSGDDLGWFWVADLYHDGVKVGKTGSYYDDLNNEAGKRYSREDQILMSSYYLCIHGQGEDCWRCGRQWLKDTLSA